eukprot:TRINITY_DN28785_c0_g1_i1.p2 TRINITY_DN28785_c0_g1~~TRINITY_DN28785_c0_g1_i1.p2  ORF type:complete len:129 (-),score=33.98 TRINITY_DN28785_c0_g1_i1:175-561(-)
MPSLVGSEMCIRDSYSIAVSFWYIVDCLKKMASFEKTLVFEKINAKIIMFMKQSDNIHNYFKPWYPKTVEDLKISDPFQAWDEFSKDQISLQIFDKQETDEEQQKFLKKYEKKFEQAQKDLEKNNNSN